MPILEDTNQTKIPADADLKARLDAFRRAPADGAAHAELAGILRAAGRHRELAEIHELHAPAERNAGRAAALWTEAGKARLAAQQRELGEKDLGRALDLDPAQAEAASALAEHLIAAQRYAEAAEVIEDELAALKDHAEALPERKRGELSPRRAERHRALAALWGRELGRVDRALDHWQRAWHLEPARTDALEAARTIYASLGDDAMVARLYEAELEVLGDRGPADRRAALELALGRIIARQGNALAAAQHLEESLRLAPDSNAAREALAEVYTSATLAGEGAHQRRATEILLELGQRRLQVAKTPADEEAGIAYLRRALGVDPGSRQATEALAAALRVSERWEDLDQLYQHFLARLEDRNERVEIQKKRVELYERYLMGRGTLRAILVELAQSGPPHGEMSQKLREFYRAEQDWAALAQHIESELPALADKPQRASAEMLELATIVREHLGERDRAAAILHHILLEIDSRHEEALARYGDHFRERRDWRGLADLLDFAIDNARKAGVDPATLSRQLEEVAEICEQRMGDIERAINTWQRIQELEPASLKPQEAIRRLDSRAKMWASLVGVLEHEAQSAQTPEKRAEALRRIAQVYRERQVNPRRAIVLYEEVATIFPEDPGVLKALGELYEREGDQPGLALTLRRRLDLDLRAIGQQLARENQGQGTAPGVRDWPTAKRVERLTSLRRLVGMYEQLGDVEGVIYACTGVLDALPGDRDTLERLERALDKSGDVERLEQTLVYHVSAATGPAEKARVLRRLARIAADKQDEIAAMQRWEEVLKTVPQDLEAIEILADLFERHERWADMARVLERGLLSQRSRAGTQTGIRRTMAQDGAGRYTTGEIRIGTGLILDPKKRLGQLVRYARVVDTKLGDALRATRAWQEVLELSPGHHVALEALTRLHEQAGRWSELGDVLAARVPLMVADEPAEAAQLALRRARLLEERIGAPAEAIKALEDIIRDLAPGHLDAHRTLRSLYEARGDFAAAVRTAERELYLSADPAEKIARGLEIGRLCRDQLQDPTRALQAFERVLNLKADHEEALTAVADLYVRVEDWPSHIRTLERLAELAPAGTARCELMTRIAQVTAERLGDHQGAFGWYRKAHEHAPSSQTLAALRRAAESFDLWTDLADVYEAERARHLDERGEPLNVQAYVAASRELAAIAERRLQAPIRAMNVLLDAIHVRPQDDRLLAEAERIASDADQRPIWQILLECQAAALERSPRSRRVALHSSRARVFEERLGEAETAVEELLQAFSWQSERAEIRQALYDLAERCGAWKDVVAVESALLERTPANAVRIAILRRKAAIIEDKLQEPVRAFRAHLVAFLLSPEDSDTVAHLWRLGRIIGAQYRDGDRMPRPEPPPAYVHPPETAPAPATARQPANKTRGGKPTRGEVPIDIESSLPVREATQELSLNDLSELLMSPVDAGNADDFDGDTGTDADAEERSGANDFSSRENSTIMLDLDEIDIEDDGFRRRDPTIQLRTEDLIQALRDDRLERSAPPPFLPGVNPRPAARKPPQPPRFAPPPPPRASAPVPLPTLPVRSYESPWEELATAYDLLPSPDKQAKMRWLFRAAEVWENGASDVGRAFNTLARALALGVDDTEPRVRLQRLASQHDAWERLADLYETAAEEAKNAETAVGLLMEVAEIRSRQKRSRDTEALYRRVLGMRPRDRLARERLEALYRAEGRWVDLAASLEERTDPRFGIAVPESERPDLLRELADIYRKLSRSHDAIDALTRLRDLLPEDVGVLRELGEMYGLVGRWSKVIETLSRVGEIAEGTTEARSALRRIAEIYERELELPDRAIDAYTQIVTQWPDDAQAYAALDKLLDALGRWTDLADILRRRAGLTRDPLERARILRRRAAVLTNRLGAPEEAAAALRHARTLTPDAPGLENELVQALISAGRVREAQALLDARVDALLASRTGSVAVPRAVLAQLSSAASGAAADADDSDDDDVTGAAVPAAVPVPVPTGDATSSAGDLAALLIRLADLQAERLGDVTGARTTLERALTLVPDHPTALAALARLIEDERDPRAFAEARLREAEALEDLDAKVEALMDAGTTLRDRCRDIEAARAAFEAVLRVRPYHSDATWALAGLVEQGGDPVQAAHVLEMRLEDRALDRREAARILTQLAALARQAGVAVVAERRLVEALEADPAHLPAIIARADFLGQAARYEDLEVFLRETLPRLESAPAETLAELNRRLAVACEHLGRDDEAYQILLAADKLHRGHLLVKLALGENRYRAKRWREAALHLSSLAMHVDATKYPAEVAEGLYHAAQAEIRSLRPEKARPLYERALDLKPNYTPALHALAELAMEQGEHERASKLLLRQAEATEEPVERMRLFEALGDLAAGSLNDQARALSCYQAAIEAAAPLESRHVGLLEKLLHRQELTGDNRGAARTAELIASFGSDGQVSAARYTAAAENFLAVGEHERALNAARRAVEADPYDLTAVTVLSQILGTIDAHEEITAVLGRALSKHDDSDEFTAPRKALLWDRLARARKARGDIKGATTAWERSVAIAGHSDGAMKARRELLEVWKVDPARREELLAYRRILAMDSLEREDVVSYARDLCRLKHDDGGRAMLDLAQAMGHRLNELDRAFLERRPVYQMAPDEAYRGAMDESLRAEVILERGDEADDDNNLLGVILSTVWEAAHLLWPETAEALLRSGVADALRVTPPSEFAAVNMFPRITAALGAPATVLYTSRSATAPDIQIVCAAAPIVVLGPGLQTAGKDAAQRNALRFLLGRTAEMLRPENIIASGLPQTDYLNLLGALLRLFGPSHLANALPAEFPDPEARREHDEALRTALPVKLRERLEMLLEDATARDIDPDRYWSALDRAADRAGLLACGDIATAIGHAGAVDEQGRRVARHLIMTALSPSYLRARAVLGVGVR